LEESEDESERGGYVEIDSGGDEEYAIPPPPHSDIIDPPHQSDHVG